MASSRPEQAIGFCQYRGYMASSRPEQAIGFCQYRGYISPLLKRAVGPFPVRPDDGKLANTGSPCG
jgi:hypothetical protein